MSFTDGEHLPACLRPYELQGGMCCGKADDLHVHQSGLPAGIEHLQFPEFLLALGIDDPQCARAGQRGNKPS
jgi:hypothetical protein